MVQSVSNEPSIGTEITRKPTNNYHWLFYGVKLPHLNGDSKVVTYFYSPCLLTLQV